MHPTAKRLAFFPMPRTCLALALGAAALGAFLAFAPAPASAQTPPPRDPFAEDAPAYNDLVARSFLIEVEPLVEKHTGWDCHWPVPFRLVTRTQYIDAMLQEIRRKFAALSPGTNPAKIDAAFRPSIEAGSIGLLGRYSSFTKSLYLLPGNLPPALRNIGVEKRFTRDVIELVLAHELTHAVQDSQEHIGDRSETIRNEQQATAWTMIIEGHASWVADCVARDLGLDEAAQRLAQQMTANSHQGADRGQSSANTRGYIAGKKFIEAVFAHGGLRAVQALFKNPPLTPDLIENPESFFALQARR